MDGGARLFGQVEVILHQRVLGPVTATGHTFPAVGAGGTPRSGAAEIGVGDRFARPRVLVGEQHTDRGAPVGVGDAHILRDLEQYPIRRGGRRIGRHAEHAGGLVVMRGEFVTPVGDVGPLLVLVEGLRRFVQGIGVDQRAAADAGAAHDEGVLEQGQPLDAETSESGRPEIFTQVPGILGEFVVGVATAGFQHADPVALLGEAQRRDAAAEPGTDHQHVVVVGLAAHNRPLPKCRVPTVPEIRCRTRENRGHPIHISGQIGGGSLPGTR